MTKRTCLTCLILLVSSFALLAQIGNQGAILGVVTDSSGAAVPNAAVSVKNLNTGLSASATSDESGNFEVLALPIGSYSVTVTLPGFTAVNAVASYAFSDQMTLSLAVNNLFDTVGYTESNDGRGAARSINGRTARATLKYAF